MAFAEAVQIPYSDSEPTSAEIQFSKFDISALVSILYCKRPEYEILAAKEIGKRSLDLKNHESIYEEGAISGIIDLLPSTSENVQIESLHALINLAYGENSRNDIRQADGIATLASVLKYIRNERIINLISLALLNLSVSDNNAEQMFHHGIVELLLIHVNTCSTTTQINILSVLANLVDYVDGHPKFQEKNGIAKLIRLLVTSKNEGIVQVIAYILAFACTTESITKEFLHLKGFTVLSYLLQNFTQNHEILSSVLKIMGRIVLTEELSKQMASSGLLPYLFATFKSSDVLIVKEATRILFIIALDPENKARIFNAGALPILTAMLKHPNESIQSSILLILVSLFAQETVRNAFFKTEGMDILTNMLSSRHHSDLVLDAFTELVESKDINASVISSSLVAQLPPLLDPEVPESTQDSVLAFFVKLIKNGSAQLSLKVFLDMAPAKRREVQQAVVNGLTHYLKSDEYKMAIFASGQLVHIENYLNSSDSEIVALARKFLDHFTNMKVPVSEEEQEKEPAPSFLETLLKLSVFELKVELSNCLHSLVNNAMLEYHEELEGSLQKLVQIVAAIIETSNNVSQSISDEKSLETELNNLKDSIKLVAKHAKDSKNSTSAIDKLEGSAKETIKITENIENILGPFANSSKDESLIPAVLELLKSAREGSTDGIVTNLKLAAQEACVLLKDADKMTNATPAEAEKISSYIQKIKTMLSLLFGSIRKIVESNTKANQQELQAIASSLSYQMQQVMFLINNKKQATLRATRRNTLGSKDLPAISTEQVKTAYQQETDLALSRIEEEIINTPRRESVTQVTEPVVQQKSEVIVEKTSLDVSVKVESVTVKPEDSPVRAPLATVEDGTGSLRNSNSLWIKCVQGTEARMIKASWTITIDQLTEIIKQKFEAKVVSLVYKDTTGDHIKIISQDDLDYSIEDFATVKDSKKMEICVTIKAETAIEPVIETPASPAILELPPIEPPPPPPSSLTRAARKSELFIQSHVTLLTQIRSGVGLKRVSQEEKTRDAVRKVFSGNELVNALQRALDSRRKTIRPDSEDDW